MKENQLTISEKIDGVVLSVIGNKALTGFQKAHTVSNAIVELEKLLDDNYMKPIMALQGTILGFKTDKVYPVDVVRRCLIEAVLKGLQPSNNEFNIIAGNMYGAKNGLKRLLDEWPGLRYTIIHSIKSWSVEKGNASFDTTIKWEIAGRKHEEVVPLITKINNYSSTDAAIGKADRKAYAWLLSNISGETFISADVDDIPHVVVESKPNNPSISDDDLSHLIKEGHNIDQIQQTYFVSDEQLLKFG